MNFVWLDYDPESMDNIEKWLDEAAVQSTGLEDGFRDFYEYWEKEEGYSVGANFWCKVIFQHNKPFAVIAFCSHLSKIIVMEILVAPEKRGRGMGSKVLRELLSWPEWKERGIATCESIIFPDNKASQKAFANAGFRCHHTYEDGSAMLYIFNFEEDE